MVIYGAGELALVEMRTRVAPLARVIEWEIDRRVAAAREPGPLTSIAVTEQHARTLLESAKSFAGGGTPYGPGLARSEEERDVLDRLTVHADRAGVTLPCARLRDHGLDELDIDLLVVIAAPSLDASFGSLYAYLQDSFEATQPGARLTSRLVATSPEGERLAREASGPFGTLRSAGLVEPAPPDRIAGPLLRPADGVVELLVGSTIELGLLGLPPVSRPASALPPGITYAEISALADAVAGGLVEVVGVWGASRGGRCGARHVVRRRSAGARARRRSREWAPTRRDRADRVRDRRRRRRRRGVARGFTRGVTHTGCARRARAAAPAGRLGQPADGRAARSRTDPRRSCGTRGRTRSRASRTPRPGTSPRGSRSPPTTSPRSRHSIAPRRRGRSTAAGRRSTSSPRGCRGIARCGSRRSSRRAHGRELLVLPLPRSAGCYRSRRTFVPGRGSRSGGGSIASGMQASPRSSPANPEPENPRGRGHRGRDRARPHGRRSVVARVEVDRRDREEPRLGLHRGGTLALRAVLRRSRHALRAARRDQPRGRSIREPRSRLPVATARPLRGPGRARHEPAGSPRRRVHTTVPAPRPLPDPGAR